MLICGGIITTGRSRTRRCRRYWITSQTESGTRPHPASPPPARRRRSRYGRPRACRRCRACRGRNCEPLGEAHPPVSNARLIARVSRQRVGRRQCSRHKSGQEPSPLGVAPAQRGAVDDLLDLRRPSEMTTHDAVVGRILTPGRVTEPPIPAFRGYLRRSAGDTRQLTSQPRRGADRATVTNRPGSRGQQRRDRYRTRRPPPVSRRDTWRCQLGSAPHCAGSDAAAPRTPAPPGWLTARSFGRDAAVPRVTAAFVGRAYLCSLIHPSPPPGLSLPHPHQRKTTMNAIRQPWVHVLWGAQVGRQCSRRSRFRTVCDSTQFLRLGV